MADLTVTTVTQASLVAGPTSTSVLVVEVYSDGTANTSQDATTDDTGAVTVTFTPASAAPYTVTVYQSVATANG
jgi:hypothetical protein